MVKVFVTGANGFVGSHLIPLLLEKGYDVHCLVRYTSNVSSLRHLNVSIHVGDLREPSTLQEPLQGVSYIFHLAATLLATSQKDFEDTNVEGTRNLLEAASVQAGGTLKRFLMVSSLAAVGPNPTPTPYDESAELQPMSWYGQSKKKAEAIAKTYFNKIPITIVRPAIVYGEREQDLSQIFPLVDNRIQPKLGLGKKSMVAIYAGDLVRGIVAAAESPHTIGKTYFLNHEEIISSKQIVKSIGIALGKPHGFNIGVPDLLIRGAAPFSELLYAFNHQRPKMTRDKAREVTQKYWVASPAKAKQDFGWTAQNNLVEGLKKTMVPYNEEKKILRAMALENNFTLWLKYLIIGLAIGVVVETISYFGGFYSFHPWWLVFAVIVFAFGFLFSSAAKALRRSATMIQLLIGILLAGGIEAANVLRVFPEHYWVFKDGWPFGITNPWIRTAVLSIPGGLFILISNIIMRNIYKHRLKYLGDR